MDIEEVKKNSNNKDFIMKAVSMEGKLLDYASDELKQDKDVVETGIVFDEKPYIAIAMANKGGNYSAYSEVLRLIGCMDDVMDEYNAYTKKES